MRMNIGQATGKGRIFVLGDTGTGTTALHDFFASNHVPSKHFVMDEAGQTDPIHADDEGNRQRFFDYLGTAEVAAFSDYPIRYFFRELYERQPDASFILTTRSSTEVWRRTMGTLLEKSGITADIDELCLSYERLNQEIEVLYSKDRKFLKVIIDDGDDGIDDGDDGRCIADFLGWKDYLPLETDVSTGSVEKRIWSKSCRMYAGEGLPALTAMQSPTHGAKAVISETGWCYLVGDTNRFLDQQFGIDRWDENQREKARAVLARRIGALDELAIGYKKFIVPEKSIVYPEYLPRALANLSTVATRPATELEAFFPEHVFYLGDSLRDAKSYGHLYFRGDTHTNWMGAWVVYRHIVDTISPNLPLARPALSYHEFVPSVASYDGDLTSLLPDDVMQAWRSRWGYTCSDGFFETTTRLSLRSPEARQVTVPAWLTQRFPKRAPLLYQRRDGQGPRAVIFRDSTVDFLCDYLAEHFSRSLFIWKDGQVFGDIVKEERPDIVLHVMAERFISLYPEFVPLA